MTSNTTALICTTGLDSPLDEAPVEIVERKGLGHPDSLCDALAEEISVTLSRYYLERFGVILHHNVDKVLLVSGESRPAFGGGRVTKPIDLYLAGRATFEARGVKVPVETLAVESCRSWLHANLRYLDPQRHVRIHCGIGRGSSDLVQLFMRAGRPSAWLANDTSIGTGFAPLTRLEQLTLRVERGLRSPSLLVRRPERGEDIKVMALRRGDRIALTVSDAFVDSALHSLDDYRTAREILRADVSACAAHEDLDVQVNAADDLDAGSIFMTVTGTSAEAGDDGEAGRGNRASGLITPCRSMSMESVAGKNPVSHVGKLYNVVAFRIAAQLVARIEGARSVSVQLVSRIGAPVQEPQLVHLHASLARGLTLHDFERRADAIVREQLAQLDRYYEDFVAHRLTIV